jgi:hypothetical protein
MGQLVVQPDDVIRQQLQAGNLVPNQQPEQPPVSNPMDGFAMPSAAGVPNIGNNGLNS